MVGMKCPALAIGLMTCTLPFAPAILPSAHAQTAPLTLPLWPHATPEPPQTTAPEIDTTQPTDNFISGRRVIRRLNVGHVVGRTFDLLGIEIPESAHIPPPTVPTVARRVMPATIPPLV